MRAVRYTSEHEEAWNDWVAESKNGTFLFDRRFMDYHRERFCDCSLLFVKDGKVTGALPANFVESERTVYSHQGLTYGGLVLPKNITTEQVLLMFDAACNYFRETLKAERLVYRPVPYIYNSYPSDEPLYALFRHGARLTSRSLSQAIQTDCALPLRQLRRRRVAHALSEGVIIERNASTDRLHTYWTLLNDCLKKRHGISPVHSEQEMALLMERFPHNISLTTAHSDNGEMLAGVWTFHTSRVLHTQYLAASDEGRRVGALDLAVDTLIRHSLDTPSHNPHYIDFGISTEQNGIILNEGLIFQKEGFGARGVCYDAYEIAL